MEVRLSWIKFLQNYLKVFQNNQISRNSSQRMILQRYYKIGIRLGYYKIII